MTSRRPREHGQFSAQWTFSQVRRGPHTVGLAILLGLLTAWLGSRTAPVPTADFGDSAGVLMWRLMAMGVGILPALGLHSTLCDLEQTHTSVHKTAERRHLLVLVVACFLVFLVLGSMTLHVALVPAVLRALLAWLGLGLVSGRLLGWRLAWVLPVAAMSLIIYWGATGDGYKWWDFTARPPGDPSSWLLSATLLAAGAAAYCASPWWRYSSSA